MRVKSKNLIENNSDNSFKNFIWKKKLSKIYLAYIAIYYFITRIIFLILGIINNFDLLFWAKEIIFPFLFSTISIITIIFIEYYNKKIISLQINENLKKQLFDLFPNKISFILVFVISILLNIEGILTNRFNIFQYFDLLGTVSIILNWIEIWQMCSLLPLAYSSLATLVLAPTMLKKMQIQEKVRIKEENILELQKLSISSIQIYVIFLIIYILTVLFNLYSENSLIIIIYISIWSTLSVFLFRTLLHSFIKVKFKKSLKILNQNEKEILFKEIYEICDLLNDWGNIREILLLSDGLFIQYFKDFLNGNKDFSNFIEFFNQNQSKNLNKIRIFIYIAAFYKFKGQYCIAQKILNELRFSKATLYRNIKLLKKERLIKKEKQDGKKTENLIPMFLI